MTLSLRSTAERRAEKAQHYEAFSAINLVHIRSEVAEALSHFGRAGILEEYTKHDITHIDAMLEMYDWIIPSRTQEVMTAADWLMVTLATYLHDFGLLVTRSEYNSRHLVAEFIAFTGKVLNSDDPSVLDYRAQLAHMDKSSEDAFLYQEFVRANHASRIRCWLLDSPDYSYGGDETVVLRLRSMFGTIEETFLEDLGLICESHHLNNLQDVRTYPISKPYGRSRDEEVNLQYAAILLRTADLLHITMDRVPSMAALVINPRNPTSQREWAKQKAVRSVRPVPNVLIEESAEAPKEQDSIEVHATFKEAEGFFGLTSYLQFASQQLLQSHAWARESQTAHATEYSFPWRKLDLSHIEAKGFVAEPFEFTIDSAKILDLLTGHTLYNDTRVVVRELVQNSLDAVRLQQHIDEAQFEPEISIAWDSGERVLTVVDNGVGMTQRVIEQNFLRVGSSRYQSADFIKQFPDFAPISRFGIGVLSAFMVADTVSVLTNSPEEPKARQISLRDVHGQYLVRLVDKQGLPPEIRDHGTSVRLRLRPSAQLSEIRATLKHWVIAPDCRVTLVVDGGAEETIGFSRIAEALKAKLLESNVARLVDGALTHVIGGTPLEIRSVKNATADVAFAVKWNRWLQEWSFVSISSDPRERAELPREFGICINGIRVTTLPPGFAKGGIAAMVNATGKGAPRTNVARSAIENTEEYNNLLGYIYAAYCGHIRDEMVAMEQQRGASLTRAAQEAEYLVHEIDRYTPESSKLLDSQLRRVPAMVLEQDGVRTSVSLVDLEEFDELATIESVTIGRFEGVLRSIRGATSASLRNLTNAMGSGEVLPAAPLVCGLSGYGVLTDRFCAEWEIVGLGADDQSRTLHVTWRRRGLDKRWLTVDKIDPNELPEPFYESMSRDMGMSISGGMEEVEDMFFAQMDIAVSGFVELSVACLGKVWLLPGHPFLSIRAATPDVQERLRLFCIGWLHVLLRESDRFNRQRNPWIDEASITDSDWMAKLFDRARVGGLFEFLEEESVRSALARGGLELLNVQRWDTRDSMFD